MSTLSELLAKAQENWSEVVAKSSGSKFAKVPAGDYICVLVNAEFKVISGDQQCILSYTVVEDEYKGQTVGEFINLEREDDSIKFLLSRLRQFDVDLDQIEASQIPQILDELAEANTPVRVSVKKSFGKGDRSETEYFNISGVKTLDDDYKVDTSFFSEENQTRGPAKSSEEKLPAEVTGQESDTGLQKGMKVKFTDIKTQTEQVGIVTFISEDEKTVDLERGKGIGRKEYKEVSVDDLIEVVAE